MKINGYLTNRKIENNSNNEVTLEASIFVLPRIYNKSKWKKG